MVFIYDLLVSLVVCVWIVDKAGVSINNRRGMLTPNRECVTYDSPLWLIIKSHDLLHKNNGIIINYDESR